METTLNQQCFKKAHFTLEGESHLKKGTFEQGPLDNSMALSSGFVLEMFHNDQFDSPITSDQESFSKFFTWTEDWVL